MCGKIKAFRMRYRFQVQFQCQVGFNLLPKINEHSTRDRSRSIKHGEIWDGFGNGFTLCWKLVLKHDRLPELILRLPELNWRLPKLISRLIELMWLSC